MNKLFRSEWIKFRTLRSHWVLLASVFVLGIVLGLARAVTGSLYLTTAMHAVTNLIATVEIHLFAGS